ncbi:MAG: hypothetical protein ASARMPRED_000441 [Alectoria sarmentosa]|nr:MAG: hypothetical protein ASARMPRED_000441 [Alectoria sarmentosa]
MLYASPSKRAAAGVIVLFFFFFSSGSLAAPLERRAIDPITFADLQLFEQFAAASYCPGNDNITAGGKKLTCASGNCPLVAADDVTTVYEFENYNSWLEARAGVLAALLTTAHLYPTYRMTIVGHSLGGAIADVAAAEIRKAGTPADLYTYGAPRIAGPVLSDYITDQKAGGNYRTTHYDDPVPRLPPRALGFVHISPEYYIDTVTGVVPTAANVTALYGNVNLLGNTGNDRNKTDVAAHGWYFNHVSAC